ncbi:copper amine oxidase N-terminal domain-containing protein [Cohnella faecalis]|nr:copper amine oxidase N-terminal domain-containing protein [Cohnella faecalis]
MKRLMLFVFAAVLAFGLTGTASAAGSAKPATATVLLNGKEVAFSAAPIVIKGKTYVEFRALFNALGYEIDYEAKTKTIKASTEGHKIEMSTGGDVAFVNGKTVASSGEIKVINSRTMIGVRFIAALTDKKVDWDGVTRKVIITNWGPTEEEKRAILGVFDKFRLIEAADDLEGFVQLFADDSGVDIKALLPNWERTKTQTTFKELLITDFSGDEAVVKVTDETVKVSGAFFPEYSSVYNATLRKSSSGEWGIYNIEVLKADILSVDKLFAQEISFPEADKAAIGALFDAQTKAIYEKKMDDFMATVTTKDDAEAEELKQQMQWFFDSFDIKRTIEKWAVVDSEENDQAIVVISALMEVNLNGIHFKVRTVFSDGVVKKGGKWTFSNTGSDSVPYLSEDVQ